MVAAAADLGLTVEIRERPAANSLAEAAALLGITPADIAKTLVVKLPGDRFVFAVIGGDTQIAWPKLRGAVGVNKMSLPTADVALAATGYERGTITPIGSQPSWPVFVDRRLVGRRVALGAGGHGYSAFVDVDDLVRGCAAIVADIAD
jgi:Cys-tRNA(Pro)/Cys-tRNA(Cys) deacylase